MPSGLSLEEEAGSPELIVISAGIILLVLAVIYFVNEALQPILTIEKQASTVTGGISNFLSSILNLLAAPFKWLLGKFGMGTSSSPTSSATGAIITPAVFSNPPSPDSNNIGPAIMDSAGNPSCPVGYTPQLDSRGTFVCVPNSSPQQLTVNSAPIPDFYSPATSVLT